MRKALKPENPKEVYDLLDSLKGKHVTYGDKEIMISEITWNWSNETVMICGSNNFRALLSLTEIIPALQNTIRTPIGFVLPGGQGFDKDLKVETTMVIVGNEEKPAIKEKEEPVTYGQMITDIVNTNVSDSKKMSAFMVDAMEKLLNKEITPDKFKAIAIGANAYYNVFKGQMDLVKTVNNIRRDLKREQEEEAKKLRNGKARNPKN